MLFLRRDIDRTDLLRQDAVQFTARRLAVLEPVLRRPHRTADGVGNDVRTERCFLPRIQPATSPSRHENRTGDRHHHLICRTCGLMVEIDCAIGVATCLTPTNDDSGCEINEAEVFYWGSCPKCIAQHRVQAETKGEYDPISRARYGRKNSETDRRSAHDQTNNS